MLLRKSLVATAVLGAASEWRGHRGNTTASAKHAPATERRILEGLIARRDFISRLSSAAGLSDPLASKWWSAALNESLAIASSRSLPAMTNLRSSCALGRREHHSVVGPAVAVGEHAADRMISFHVHAHGGAVPQFVADMEMDAFAHDELPLTLHVDGFPGLALHRPWRVGKPRHRDLCRGRQFQAEIAGLADLGRKVAAGIMHRMRQRLVCYVDHELLMMLDVDQRVLDAAVGPPDDGEHAERRILAEHVEKAEGRGVDHAGGSNRRYPGDRPRQDESCQQLVAIARREIVSGVFHTGDSLSTTRRTSYPRSR